MPAGNVNPYPWYVYWFHLRQMSVLSLLGRIWHNQLATTCLDSLLKGWFPLGRLDFWWDQKWSVAMSFLGEKESMLLKWGITSNLCHYSYSIHPGCWVPGDGVWMVLSGSVFQLAWLFNASYMAGHLYWRFPWNTKFLFWPSWLNLPTNHFYKPLCAFYLLIFLLTSFWTTNQNIYYS